MNVGAILSAGGKAFDAPNRLLLARRIKETLTKRVTFTLASELCLTLASIPEESGPGSP